VINVKNAEVTWLEGHRKSRKSPGYIRRAAPR
jgi:hypothetical protein